MSESEIRTRGTVLLTGVEPRLRAGLRQALGDDRLEVLDAVNGFAAFRAYSRKRGEVDLLIAPVEMRDYDGLALARGLSTLSSRLPVLLLAGDGEAPESPSSNVRILDAAIGVEDLAEEARRVLGAWRAERPAA